jgi:hypothetical protein
LQFALVTEELFIFSPSFGYKTASIYSDCLHMLITQASYFLRSMSEPLDNLYLMPSSTR